MNNHGFINLNKNFGSKLKENNYSQNIGNHVGNKIYTMGSFNRKDNIGNNMHKNDRAVNQKRIISGFNMANFKSKDKLNKLVSKKIHFKK